MMKFSEVSMLLLVSCLLVVPVYPLEFVSQTNTNQQWVFEEGSNATLVCTNSPYTGVHTFTFDATPVLSCLGTVCSTTENDQDGFLFEYNTDSGVFTWIINFVKMIYNGKVFGCKDGLEDAQYSATVQGKSLSFKVHNSQDGLWTFKEGSTVELVCTNYPYTGIHEFTLDSATVCFCMGSKCITKNNDQGGFSFKNNAISGVFNWTLNNVKMDYNGKLFGCKDGLNHVEYTVIVEGDSEERHRSHWHIAIFGTLLLVTVIVFSLWFVRRYLTQRKTIPPEQSNMTEIEMMLNPPTKADDETSDTEKHDKN